MADRRRRGRAPRPALERAPPGPEAAMELAARFLATRPRSRWEVERRLKRGDAPPEVIERTVERLAELGLVDDLAFSRWWLEQRDRHAPRGRRMLEAELRQHGIGRETIERLRDELAETAAEVGPAAVLDEELPHTEGERAAAALAGHLRGRPIPDDPRAQQRLGMYLVRRGFDPETARTAIRAATSVEDDLEDEAEG